MTAEKVDEPLTDDPSENVADAKALERLRDRTDELELIISSLTIFALYSIPGWLFDTFADSYTHVSTSIVIAGMLITALLAGFCYGLGTCFVVHLMARAYWVGLIGLRAAFPRGINWKRTPTLGPLTRAHYKASLPDLSTIIERTDRLASSLFAVISMLTLVMLWLGTIMVLTLVAAGSLGSYFAATNAALGNATLLIIVLFAGVPLLIYLLDAQLAARIPELENNRLFRTLISSLRRVSSLAYPKRLVLPVQLTLQSNTRPIAFFVTLTLAVFVIVTVGNMRLAGWRDFTLSSEFTYLSDEDVIGSFRSTYYEDMESPKDRLRAWPRVSSFVQNGSTVRLFLPYQPLRDNLILDQICDEPRADTDRVGCLRKLWSVSLAGKSVSMQSFFAAERGDLAMRGLIGVVPLEGLQPGTVRLEVVWNPNPQQDEALDDRYTDLSIRYTIPINFAPEYERALDDEP